MANEESLIVPSPLTWTTTLLSVLQKRKLKCHLLSPQSSRFQYLHQRLEVKDEYFSEVSGSNNFSQQTNAGLSREVEKNLFDAFAENDFDDDLHLLIVEEEGDKEERDLHESQVLGIVFWRDVPSKEMNDWLNLSDSKDMDEVMRLLEHIEESSSCDHDLASSLLEQADMSSLSLPTPESRKRQLSFVRRHSALSFQPTINRNDDTLSISSDSVLKPRSIREVLTHAWIKIELLAVKKSFWGRRIGSLLLACCLYHAYTGATRYNDERNLLLDVNETNSFVEKDKDEEGNLIIAKGEITRQSVVPSHPAQHCVLHVAGGKNNIPALRLYHRFGFIPASHLFTKPNKDLYILGDIGQSLERLFYASNT